MRFLLLLLAFIWILMLLRSILKAAVQSFLRQASRASESSSSPEKSGNEAHRLVRDPECGIYIRQDRALPVTSGAGSLHFCSPACRDRYFARQQKLAASA